MFSPVTLARRFGAANWERMPPRKPVADPLPPEPDEVPFREEADPPSRWAPDPEPDIPGWAPDPYARQQAAPAFLGDAPPMVATVHREAVQFVVKVDDNGRHQELGRIATKATHEHLIAKFWSVLQAGGTVYLFPIDMNSRVLCRPDEPYVVDISPHHEAIRRVAAKQVAGVVGGAGIPASSDLLAILGPLLDRHTAPLLDQIRIMREDQARKDAEYAAREARLAKLDEKLAEQKLALAVTAIEQQTDFTKTIHETTSRAHEQSVGNMAGMFQGMIAQQQAQSATLLAQLQASAQMERERIKAENDATLARIDAERARDRELAERRDKEEERARAAKAKEEEQFRRDREDWMNKAHERELQAQRDHANQTLKLIEATRDASDPVKMITTLSVTAAPLLKAVGFDPKDLGELVKGMVSGKAGGGWLDAVVALGEKAADTALELKKLDMEGSGGGEDDDDVMVVQTPQGQVQITRAQYKQLQAAQAAGQLPAPPQQPQAPQQMISPMTPWPAGTPGVPQGNTQPAGNAPPPAAAPNPGDALPPDVQRAGRKAARSIVAGLATAADKVSTGLVLLNEHKAALEPYVRATGVRFALNEAGADAALVEEIVTLIAPLLPPGVSL